MASTNDANTGVTEDKSGVTGLGAGFGVATAVVGFVVVAAVVTAGFVVAAGFTVETVGVVFAMTNGLVLAHNLRCCFKRCTTSNADSISIDSLDRRSLHRLRQSKCQSNACRTNEHFHTHPFFNLLPKLHDYLKHVKEFFPSTRLSLTSKCQLTMDFEVLFPGNFRWRGEIDICCPTGTRA